MTSRPPELAQHSQASPSPESILGVAKGGRQGPPQGHRGHGDRRTFQKGERRQIIKGLACWDGGSPQPLPWSPELL